MTIPLTIKGGTTRNYPQNKDRGYGVEATNWASDVTTALNNTPLQTNSIQFNAVVSTDATRRTHPTLEDVIADGAITSGMNVLIDSVTFSQTTTLDITKSLNIFGLGNSTFASAAALAGVPIIKFSVGNVSFNNITIDGSVGTPTYAIEVAAGVSAIEINSRITGTFSVDDILNDSTDEAIIGSIVTASGNYLLPISTPGANSQLSNLSGLGTAINEALVYDTNNTYDLSSDALEIKDVWTHGVKHNDAVNPNLNIGTTGNNGDVTITPHGTGKVILDGTIEIESGVIDEVTNDLTIQASAAGKDVKITANKDVVLNPGSNSAYIDKSGIEYEILTQQAVKDLNNYILPATTNTSFSSTTSNNPYGFYFDDGKPRYGCERIHFMGLVEIKSGDNMPIADSAGKKGYHPIDQFGKIRYNIGCYGNFSFFGNVDDGNIVVSGTTAGDYIVFTDVFNKCNLLARSRASGQAIFSNYLDGVDTTNNLSLTGSDVLYSKYYSPNVCFNINIGVVSQGIHTVKLVRDDTNTGYITGIEIVNEANSSTHELCVPASNQIIKGKQLSISAQTGVNALPVKGSTNNGGSAITGTKGGFVGYYIDENGYYISKVQEPTAVSQSGAIAYNAASSDSITGLSDSSKFYANSQGNIIRVKDAGSIDRMLLVPTAAPTASSLTCANDYDGVADTTLFAGNKQFQDDGTTGVTFADLEAVTVELYAKIGANADHTNEELYTVKAWDKVKNKIVDRSRTLHFGDFGNQRSDDFTSIAGSSMDCAFTMDDGGTTLVAEDNSVSNGALALSAGSDFNILTFYGSGLDLELKDLGIRKVCSDLPLGFHTFKVSFDGTNLLYDLDGIRIKSEVGSTNMYLFNYLIYRPKKPALTDNYEYAFYNYVLADYVKTNLPTLNLSAYNGAIDQGVIRSACVREFVYSTNFSSYGSVDTTKASGRIIESGITGSTATIQKLISGYLRSWMRVNNTTANVNININGSLDTTWDSGNTNLNGVCSTSNKAEALYSLQIEQSGAGALDLDSLDYHTPVFNQFYNLANPFPDYLMGQSGVLDNRKLVAYDEKPEKRLIQAQTTVADGTSSDSLLLGAICTDCIVIKAEGYGAHQVAANGVGYVAQTLNLDGVTLSSDFNASYSTGDIVSVSPRFGIGIAKRVRISTVASQSKTHQYRTQLFNYVIKIEEAE